MFLLVSTDGFENSVNKENINYIKWFQYVNDKIKRIKEISFIDKIKFLTSLLTIKCWASYKVLGTNVFFINLIFSCIFYLNNNLFENLNKNIISAFYYSFVTFTTLGYGDIYPVHPVAQLLVTFEVIVGYITLGIFVFLIGDKVNKKY